MAVQLPPNSTGSVVDTQTTLGSKERQCFIPAIGGAFNVVNTPAAAAQATITQAAAGAGISNICNRISASLATVATAQAAAVQLNLRDGATGAGTILWSKTFSCGTTAMVTVDVTGLYIVGSPNTAMTLEFSAAPVAGAFESVALGGVTNA